MDKITVAFPTLLTPLNWIIIVGFSFKVQTRGFRKGETPTHINAPFVTTTLFLWYVQYLSSEKNNRVSAIRFQARKIYVCFSSPVRLDQTQSPAILLFNAQWGFNPWRETGRCLKLITDFHSVLLWISGVKPPPSHKPSWWEQGQMCYSNLLCLFKITIKI